MLRRDGTRDGADDSMVEGNFRYLYEIMEDYKHAFLQRIPDYIILEGENNDGYIRSSGTRLEFSRRPDFSNVEPINSWWILRIKWRVYNPAQKWDIKKAINEIFGYGCIVGVFKDCYRPGDGLASFNIIGIRKTGERLSGAKDLGTSSYSDRPLDHQIQIFVKNLRSRYAALKNISVTDLEELPTDFRDFKKSLGV